MYNVLYEYICSQSVFDVKVPWSLKKNRRTFHRADKQVLRAPEWQREQLSNSSSDKIENYVDKTRSFTSLINLKFSKNLQNRYVFQYHNIYHKSIYLHRYSTYMYEYVHCTSLAKDVNNNWYRICTRSVFSLTNVVADLATDISMKRISQWVTMILQ